MGRKERLASRERLQRIRLLSSELDTLRNAAIERTRSIDTKSSFVVVAAGVLAGATFTGLVDARSWYLGLVPFALTVATIIAAAVSLWPSTIDSPSGRFLVTRWVNASERMEAMEDYILEVKVREIEKRNSKNEKRAKATKSAFVLLVSGVVTALLVAGINASVLRGDPTNGQTNPVHTPSAPERPDVEEAFETLTHGDDSVEKKNG